MELYSDPIVRLEYEIANNLLVASLQGTRAYGAREVRSAFASIAAAVHENGITHLLLDFTRNTYDLSYTEYKQTVAQLTVGLLRTPLQKVARLQTGNPHRESKIAALWEEIKTAISVSIELQMFKTNAAARHWLLA